MPTNFHGKWTMDRHGGMSDELMDSMDIPADRRPSLPITKLDIEITQDGDKFTIKTESAEQSKEYSFEVGSTFETSLVAFLPKMTVSSAWEGDKLLFTTENGFKMLREIIDGQMVTTVSKDNVSFQVFFNKV